MATTTKTERRRLAKTTAVYQWTCCICAAETVRNGDASEWGPERWDSPITGIIERDGARYLTSSGLCPACRADYETWDHPRLDRRRAMMDGGDE